MAIEDTFGDRDSDEFVKVLTSPAFWVGPTTSVEIWTVGGVGDVDAPTWTNYADLPVVATLDDGFLGAALRRVRDGEYLLFSRRSQVGERLEGYEAIGWDAPTIAAAVAGDGPGEQYVVDIIDTFTAYGTSPWWAWIGVDDITLTDVEIVSPTAISVPNGSFEEIYKPGSTTITADIGGGWTNGVGPNTPMNGDQIATYSDETTGNTVDIPGWINVPDWPPSYDWPVGCGSVAKQTTPPDGDHYYTANGSNWGNSQGGAIESDAPLARIESGLAYTVAMLANGPVTPVVLELLADGEPLTPSSSVDPNAPYEWEEFSRTYDTASLADHVGKSLTIRVGFGPDAVGTQSHIDAVSLSFVKEE
jgi:hypothetical protein